MKQIVSVLAAALMLVPASAGARSKKKQAAPQLSALEVVEKVNNHWQAANKPEVNAFWDNAVYFTGNMP